MNKLNELKAELKEKEKKCMKNVRCRTFMGAGSSRRLITGVEQVYRPTKILEAEISALKKGISACEEILNSQSERKDKINNGGQNGN